MLKYPAVRCVTSLKRVIFFLGCRLCRRARRKSASLECCPDWFHHRSLQACLSASLAGLTRWHWTHHGTTWVQEFGAWGIWMQPLNYGRHNNPNNIMHLTLMPAYTITPQPQLSSRPVPDVHAGGGAGWGGPGGQRGYMWSAAVRQVCRCIRGVNAATAIYSVHKGPEWTFCRLTESLLGVHTLPNCI